MPQDLLTLGRYANRSGHAARRTVCPGKSAKMDENIDHLGHVVVVFDVQSTRRSLSGHEGLLNELRVMINSAVNDCG